MVTFDYSGGPSVELTSGTKYWLVAVQTHSNTFDYWYDSNSDYGMPATSDSSSVTGPWTVYSPTLLPAFQVDGTTMQTVPEASSVLLLAVVLLAFAGLFGYRKLSASD